MESPVRITHRHVPPSEALRRHIQGEADKLKEFFDRIVDCHVVVDRPNRHSQGGQPFRVRVELLVPGEKIVGAVDPTTEKQHEDVYLAVSEAFHAARRELQDYVRRRRGYVKSPSCA
jgi:ribosomal subunit interface protein